MRITSLFLSTFILSSVGSSLAGVAHAAHVTGEKEIVKLCDNSPNRAERRAAGKKMVQEVKELALKWESLNGHADSKVTQLEIPDDNFSVDSDTAWIQTHVLRANNEKVMYTIEVLFLTCSHEQPDITSSESVFGATRAPEATLAGVTISDKCTSAAQRAVSEYMSNADPLAFTAKATKDGQMLIQGSRMETDRLLSRPTLRLQSYDIVVEETESGCLVHSVR